MTGRNTGIMAAVLAFTFVLAIIGTRPVRAADDASQKRPAEFAVLDRWVGDWDLEITVKPNRGQPKGHKAVYQSSVRWTLNDRFLRCEAKGQSADADLKMAESFMWIITHDPQSKRYSSTVFWSNIPEGLPSSWGTVPNGIGTWDEMEQMLSIRSEDKETGLVTLSMTQWIDKDHHRWVQSMTDKNGNLVAEMSGTGKRRK